MTDKDSAGDYYLCCSGFELYGKVKLINLSTGLSGNDENKLFKEQRSTTNINENKEVEEEKYNENEISMSRINEIEPEIVRWIATDDGTNESWHLSERIVSIASSIASYRTDSDDILRHESDKYFVSKNLENSWIIISFLTKEINPTSYSLGHHFTRSPSTGEKIDKNGILRSWKFEGSCDGKTWILLSKHQETQRNFRFFDKEKTAEGVETWQLCKSEQFYSHFRILQIGVNGKNTHQLVCSRFEIYGQTRNKMIHECFCGDELELQIDKEKAINSIRSLRQWQMSQMKRTEDDQSRDAQTLKTLTTKNVYAHKCYTCQRNINSVQYYACNTEYSYLLNGINHIQICKECMDQIEKWIVADKQKNTNASESIIKITQTISESNPHVMYGELIKTKLQEHAQIQLCYNNHILKKITACQQLLSSCFDRYGPHGIDSGEEFYGCGVCDERICNDCFSDDSLMAYAIHQINTRRKWPAMKNIAYLIKKYKDIKALWRSDCLDVNRTCFIEIEISYLNIDEKLENGTAECDIKMTVKLYWLFSQTDYDSYRQCKDKHKWRPKTGDKDKTDHFIPQFKFMNVIEHTIEEVNTGVVFLRDFFGKEYLQNMQSYRSIYIHYNNEIVQFKIEAMFHSKLQNQYLMFTTVKEAIEAEFELNESFIIYDYDSDTYIHNTDELVACFAAEDDDYIPKLHIVKEEKQDIRNHIRMFDVERYKSAKQNDCLLDQYHELGYMGYIETFCEARVSEPFELKSFPFDCQDIPFFIQPENFAKIAPAYLAKEQSFLSIVAEATNLGIWNIESTVTEFDTGCNDNKMCILFKISRYWSPYLVQYVFLIASVCILSLTAYALDIEDKPDRVGIVLGLILTLIFIEIPRLPI
eukprot:357538_1